MQAMRVSALSPARRPDLYAWRSVSDIVGRPTSHSRFANNRDCGAAVIDAGGRAAARGAAPPGLLQAANSGLPRIDGATAVAVNERPRLESK